MASTNEDEAISKLTQHIEDLSTNNDIILEVCANCGKEVINNPNTCNKCKAATYCNASCKKKHRSKHKTDCAKHVAEVQEEQLERERRAAELHDRELFKQPPPKEDCDICMLTLPTLYTGKRYKSCCGKIICSGCIHAVRIRDAGDSLCPFCRTPTPTRPEGSIEQTKKRVDLGDAHAIYEMGNYYYHGMYGLPQHHVKALELFHRAAELCHAAAYYGIGVAYNNGNGVERDETKANHYWELAAIGGDVDARHNLGCSERDDGNCDRALKHWLISAGGGEKESLTTIQEMFKKGVATKEDYTQALRAYQAYLGEIKSVQRNEAAAADDEYKYYEL